MGSSHELSKIMTEFCEKHYLLNIKLRNQLKEYLRANPDKIDQIFKQAFQREDIGTMEVIAEIRLEDEYGQRG